MVLQIFNLKINRTRRSIASTKDTHTIANARPHSSHQQVSYPNNIQATSCHPVRGNTRRYLIFTQFVTIGIDTIVTTPAEPRPWALRNIICHDFKMLAVHAGKLCTLTLTPTHPDRHIPARKQNIYDMRRCYVPTCADLFPLISSGHVFCSPFLHVV